METRIEGSWRYDYKHRYALDEGEGCAWGDHDWRVVPVGEKFIVMSNGEIPKRAETLQEAMDIIHDLIN